MAYALVQQALASSTAFTWPSTPTAGNLLVVAGVGNSGSAKSDLVGWTEVINFSEGNQGLAIWSKEAVGDETTEYFTLSSPTNVACGGWEYSGSPLTQTSLTSETDSGLQTWTLASAAPAGDLLIAMRANYWATTGPGWNGTPDGSSASPSAQLAECHWLSATANQVAEYPHWGAEYGAFACVSFTKPPPAAHTHRLTSDWTATPLTVRRRSSGAWIEVT